MSDEGQYLCAAGVTALFGGKWRYVKRHFTDTVLVILTEDPNLKIELCEQHFNEVNEAGYITEPYLPEDDPRRQRFEHPND